MVTTLLIALYKLHKSYKPDLHKSKNCRQMLMAFKTPLHTQHFYSSDQESKEPPIPFRRTFQDSNVSGYFPVYCAPNILKSFTLINDICLRPC